ncbi:AraC family transcriptional regulator [Allohahella marinimesophila]|uniref:AraC family transcriptional regulator n=1 Tax=Allohahella marinimesophila TaxID=1054972 RepID=A0ABP7NLD7_9GAMM
MNLFVRSASLYGYAGLASESGVNTAALMARCGLPENVLQNDDLLVSADRFCKLLEITATESGRPTFGLELSARQSIAILGVVGNLLCACSTLGEALQLLRRFLYVHSQSGQIDYSIDGQQVMVVYTPLVSHEGRAAQVIDLTLALGLSIVGRLVGGSLPGVSVYLAHQVRPEDASRYRAVFGCPVLFNQDSNVVVFPLQLLNRRVSPDATLLLSFRDTLLKQQALQRAPDLVGRLEIALRQCIPLGDVSIQQFAQLLHVPVRTLQRRLAKKNLSFRGLLDTARTELAMRYLRETTLPVAAIADLLGYGEAAAFSRRFKTLTGKSPLAYRNA